MVTGIRQDAWANAHRIPVEEEKQGVERGVYIHPELFGQPRAMSIEFKRTPRLARESKSFSRRKGAMPGIAPFIIPVN